jgi:hypothetical protein
VRREMHIRIVMGKPEGKRPLGRQDVGGWTILKWILDMGWDGVDWIDMAQDRDPVEGSSEHDIEPSGSMKFWEVLELLLKKGSAP